MGWFAFPWSLIWIIIRVPYTKVFIPHQNAYRISAKSNIPIPQYGSPVFRSALDTLPFHRYHLNMPFSSQNSPHSGIFMLFNGRPTASSGSSSRNIRFP